MIRVIKKRSRGQCNAMHFSRFNDANENLQLHSLLQVADYKVA